MKLLMARHGQSEWQIRGDIVGSDPKLTPLGELQAHRLGDYLARRDGMDTIISSPLQRARHTAEIVASYLDLPVIIDDDLQEFNDWEAGWVSDSTSMWDPTPVDGGLTPGYSRFSESVAAALQRVIDQTPREGRALIVAHGGTIGTIWRVLLGAHTSRLPVWNAALHEAEWEPSQWGTNWVFHSFNAMDHLPSFMRTF